MVWCVVMSMGRRDSRQLGTHASQLPSVVECEDCGTDIRESQARGQCDTGYYCRDCHDSDNDLMLQLFPLAEDDD